MIRVHNSKKAQLGLEYLFILGIVLVGIISIFGKPVYERLTIDTHAIKAQQAVSLLAQTADDVYQLGTGNKKCVPLDIPEDVLSGMALDTEVIMNLQTAQGATQLTAPLQTGNSLYGTLPTLPGRYRICVEQTGNSFATLALEGATCAAGDGCVLGCIAAADTDCTPYTTTLQALLPSQSCGNNILESNEQCELGTACLSSTQYCDYSDCSCNDMTWWGAPSPAYRGPAGEPPDDSNPQTDPPLPPPPPGNPPPPPPQACGTEGTVTPAIPQSTCQGHTCPVGKTCQSTGSVCVCQPTSCGGQSGPLTSAICSTYPCANPTYSCVTSGATCTCQPPTTYNCATANNLANGYTPSLDICNNNCPGGTVCSSSSCQCNPTTPSPSPPPPTTYNCATVNNVAHGYDSTVDICQDDCPPITTICVASTCTCNPITPSGNTKAYQPNNYPSATATTSGTLFITTISGNEYLVLPLNVFASAGIATFAKQATFASTSEQIHITVTATQQVTSTIMFYPVINGATSGSGVDLTTYAGGQIKTSNQDLFIQASTFGAGTGDTFDGVEIRLLGSSSTPGAEVEFSYIVNE